MSTSIELIKAPAPFFTASMQLFSLPFDMARHQYAYAQQVGLIPPSMVAGAKFGRAIGALETLTLGPWSRQV